ncbi:unnamed protein product [Heterobilharzia americana]|nr:unnamed protein product [Heterobilharzia americana]
MSDDKLDPPSPYINADSISQTCIQHLEPFCSRCIVHTVESDLLPISEISQSPSLDLFGEPITSSPYKDSPPIGRIKINTPSCSWKNSESSNSIQQICPHTDSGFSSWTGVGDSKTRSPPNLVPSCCALPHSVYAPLTSSNRDSDFMFSQSGEDLLSWDPENLNESDVNSRSFGTNPGPCLSNLPCANDLNEELSDRMFVRSMGDMVKNPPTWSAPWPCSNTYSSCAYTM